MVLATAKIGDFDQFWNTFSTKGAEKRKQHGSKGAHVFRDPNDEKPGLGDLRLGRGRLAELHLGSRGPGNLSGSRFYARSVKSAEFLREHDA